MSRILQQHKTWLEMDCNLKKIRLMFSSLSSCLGELKKPLIMIYSFFANSLDIFLLVFYKLMLCLRKVVNSNVGQF